jgi:transposase
MIWIGIDAHKRVHQALALSVDGVLGQKTIANTAVGWTELLRWSSTWPERIWAVEGSGSLGRGPAQFLALRGERVYDVNPRWTAQRRRACHLDLVVRVGCRGAAKVAFGLRGGSVR